MAHIVTLPHELRGRELHRWPGRRSETRRDLGKPGGQRQRGDKKAQAQGGADGFAVGADVNDAPGAIDRGKRWRGSPLQLQLAQIVILDHPGLFLSGPVQES